MNRYQDPIKTFYLWSMADALILFPLLDLVTGLISDPSSPRQGECPAGGE